MKISELRTNCVAEPLGYSYAPLSFSWKVEDAKTGKEQKSARITVKNHSEIAYDSGETADADSLDYPVDLELKPRSRYEWTVSVTADSGESAEAGSYFETGKLGEDWVGKWITPGSGIVDADTMAGYILEKTFAVDKTGEARLYLCGLGVYECYINGKKVGEEFLAPGYYSYDFHIQTNTYDVTEYLVSGENKLELWLGEGWFKSRLGFDGGIPNLYGDKLYAISCT